MPDENQPVLAPVPTQNSDQPSRESNIPSFRDRAMQRLGSDRDTVEPEEKVAGVAEASQPSAHETDGGYPDEDLQSQDEQTTEGMLETEVEPENVESVFSEQDIPELRQRAEEAETMVTSMQSDYTRKTQKLGESRRELLNNLDQSQKIASVYAERAEQAVKRYENVNWQQLQSTLDPQIYNQRVNEYRQVMASRDREVQAHQQIQKFASDQIEQQKQDQAEISRDVLKSTVPGWGNDLYGTLRDHASKALDFTSDEFDQITDHRVIKLIHNSWKVSQTGSKIEHIQHNGSRARAPVGGSNKERSRSANGQYKSAQAHHLSNPGDRNATREAFRQRLRAEKR